LRGPRADEPGLGASNGEAVKASGPRVLAPEMHDYLGYVKGDPAGNGSGIPATGITGRR